MRLRDVARVELGGENSTLSFYNGKPSSGLAVRLASGANALDTADAVKAKTAELERFFLAALSRWSRSTRLHSFGCRSKKL